MRDVYTYYFREVKMLMVYYELEMCLVIWMQFKLICKNMANMLML